MGTAQTYASHACLARPLCSHMRWMTKKRSRHSRIHRYRRQQRQFCFGRGADCEIVTKTKPTWSACVCVCVVFICDAHTALAESTMFYSVCFSLSRAASLLYEQHTQRLNWICFLCCVSSLATGLLNARVYCAPSKPIQPSTDPIQRVFITYEKYNKIFDDYETGCGHTPPHHLSIYTFVQCSCPMDIVHCP